MFVFDQMLRVKRGKILENLVRLGTGFDRELQDQDFVSLSFNQLVQVNAWFIDRLIISEIIKDIKIK